MNRCIVVCSLLLILASSQAVADIPSDRLPPGSWDDIRWADPNPGGWITVDVTTKGITPGGGDVSSAVSSLISSSSDYTILYFPPGEYSFNNRIELKRDNIIIKGAGPQTVFDFSGSGFVSYRSKGSEIAITSDVAAGSRTIPLSSTSGMSVNDFIMVVEDIDDYEAEWGRRSRGGMFYITAISGNTITIDLPLAPGLAQVSSKDAVVQKMSGVKNIGLESFRIERRKGSSGSTFDFSGAQNLYIRNVESYMTGKHHVDIYWCRDIIVEGSLFDDAYDHGTGGMGYGVLLESLTTRSLITNNIFKDLRHEMAVQTGGLYNVFSYNYDVDWYQDLCFDSPSDSLCRTSSSQLHADDIYYECDVAVHGHWANHNLWEGNKFYYSAVDNSHRANGPLNTFFRNHFKGQPPAISWKAGVGMVVDSSQNNQNVIGNTFVNNAKIEVNSGTSGNFVGANDGGGYRDDMSGNPSIPDSLYLEKKPDFWPSSLTWPPFGPDVSNGGSNKIPAQLRYEGVDVSTCSTEGYLCCKECASDHQQALDETCGSGEKCCAVCASGGGSGVDGDVDGDGDVDIFDLVLVAQNFGLSSGFDERADANDDGQIDIFDLVIVAQNFG